MSDIEVGAKAGGWIPFGDPSPWKIDDLYAELCRLAEIGASALVNAEDCCVTFAPPDRFTLMRDDEGRFGWMVSLTVVAVG